MHAQNPHTRCHRHCRLSQHPNLCCAAPQVGLRGQRAWGPAPALARPPSAREGFTGAGGAQTACDSDGEAACQGEDLGVEGSAAVEPLLDTEDGDLRVPQERASRDHGNQPSPQTANVGHQQRGLGVELGQQLAPAPLGIGFCPATGFGAPRIDREPMLVGACAEGIVLGVPGLLRGAHPPRGLPHGRSPSGWGMPADGAVTTRLGRLLSDGFSEREGGISPGANRRATRRVLLSGSVEARGKERYACCVLA